MSIARIILLGEQPVSVVSSPVCFVLFTLRLQPGVDDANSEP